MCGSKLERKIENFNSLRRTVRNWWANSFEWPLGPEIGSEIGWTKRRFRKIGNKSEWNFADKKLNEQILEGASPFTSRFTSSFTKSRSSVKISTLLVKGTHRVLHTRWIFKWPVCTVQIGFLHKLPETHGDRSANHLISANSTLRVIAVDGDRRSAWFYECRSRKHSGPKHLVDTFIM